MLDLGLEAYTGVLQGDEVEKDILRKKQHVPRL